MTNVHNPPKQWEIWWADQKGSRANTNPPVPSDPIRPERLFIVITLDAYNSGGHGVVALPLTTKPLNPVFEVELTKGTANLNLTSFVKCYQPTPIEDRYLIKSIGQLTDKTKINKIKETLADFLDLR